MEATNYNDMNIPQLRRLVADRGLQFGGARTKPELIYLLTNADARARTAVPVIPRPTIPQSPTRTLPLNTLPASPRTPVRQQSPPRSPTQTIGQPIMPGAPRRVPLILFLS